MASKSRNCCEAKKIHPLLVAAKSCKREYSSGKHDLFVVDDRGWTRNDLACDPNERFEPFQVQ
jgi:hypothetical protein